MSDAVEWRRLRLRFAFDVIDRRVGTPRTDLPLLSVSIHHGVRPRDEMTDREARADEFTNYKLVEPQDLVINRMRAFEGGAGMSAYTGIVSGDYAVLRTRPVLDPGFFHHLIRSSWFVGEMTARLRGIGTAELGNVRTPRINVEDLGNIEVLLPPPWHQRAIAEYLDAETARIDAALSALSRRGELLLEHRRAAISDAMSGPWRRVRVKHLAAANRRALGEDAPPDWTFRYVDISAVDSWGHITPSDEIAFSAAPSRARRLANVGDIIISTVRTYLRAITPVPTFDTPLVFSTGFAVLSPLPHVEPRFLRWAVQSDEFLHEVVARSVGINYPSVNVEDLIDIGLPLPPPNLQTEIADRLDQLSHSLSRVLVDLSRQTDLLLERRQALITAAVTGQLEIPGVAA